jgi:hypothetical protein
VIRLLLENLQHRRRERLARRGASLDVATQLRILQLGGTVPTSSNVLCGCGRLMGPIKNGVAVEELDEDGAPYKLWRADRYGCADCGATVIVGFGRDPIAEHYQESYATTRERAGEIFPARCRPGTRVTR